MVIWFVLLSIFNILACALFIRPKNPLKYKKEKLPSKDNWKATNGMMNCCK